MEYQLAQINIARMKEPLHHPLMADFVNNLDRINALAERSEGFVWRLADEANNATSMNIFDDEFLIVNMSVWDSITALMGFTYASAHSDILKRRTEWFGKMKDRHMACWYIPAHSIPTPAQAKDRLAYLQRHGETPFAFTFRSPFTIDAMRDYTPINMEI